MFGFLKAGIVVVKVVKKDPKVLDDYRLRCTATD